MHIEPCYYVLKVDVDQLLIHNMKLVLELANLGIRYYSFQTVVAKPLNVLTHLMVHFIADSFICKKQRMSLKRSIITFKDHYRVSSYSASTELEQTCSLNILHVGFMGCGTKLALRGCFSSVAQSMCQSARNTLFDIFIKI